MQLLLDAQCWLWMQASPHRFAADALELVQSTENDLLLSAASAWEIAIKHALGRLPLPVPPAEYVPSRMAANGVLPLQVTHSHALRVATLPARHRDPFDRLIIAQALVEKIPILTADRQFAPYEVTVRWAC